MSRFRIDWSKKDERLLALRAEGWGDKRIAEALGVTHGAVYQRRLKLGIA
jgi:DNA-binding NarL/FixJ family response regulator